MKVYLEYIRISLKLAQRDRVTLFFNYIFPLIFFVIFAQAFHAGQGGAIVQVVTMVLIIGILGSGFFGAGVRAVQDREANILRRFKVAPISPLPILVASMITGFLVYMPTVIVVLAVAHFRYGLPVTPQWPALLVFTGLGMLAFRAVGLIIASVVNSMQESQILVQIFYLPMLFLSGATFPVSELPGWLQIIAQFMPATYLYTGMQGILFRQEGLLTNWLPVVGLMVTGLLATFIGTKLFRWEKEEKLPAANKAWLVAVLGPFLLIGAYQAYSRENVAKARILFRELRRSRTVLIQNARIFLGDGTVINHGAVLLRGGSIAEIYRGAAPPAGSLRAEALEASGKTLLPGLIDTHVHLSAPGGLYQNYSDYNPDRAIPRELAVYLYSGVTTVRSAGDPTSLLMKLSERFRSGERLGSELVLCGPLFTAEGGHGTEYFKRLPAKMRSQMEAQFVRAPRTPEEAREQVRDLKKQGVNGIKTVLESGANGTVFNRLDTNIFRAVVEEAHAQHLPVTAHTGDVRDVTDAVDAGVDGIEHGSGRQLIPNTLFAEMKRLKIAYDPTLVVFEAMDDLRRHSTRLLDRSLVEQVGPARLLAGTRRLLAARPAEESASVAGDLATARENLKRAWQAGVTLVTGTDSGNLLVVHGPAIHRELQLWVEAGIPPAAALQAATGNAARALGRDAAIGTIAKGLEANLLLVDGNPLDEISDTERISSVFLRGERVARADLFDQ